MTATPPPASPPHHPPRHRRPPATSRSRSRSRGAGPNVRHPAYGDWHMKNTAPYDPQSEARWVPEPDKRPGRTAFQRDRARVLHSAALRRLA
ncbi:MAG: hypothetical protein LBV78_11780, partial [Kitasatospora sp.]|nr:hypothetical protein [Kitasatospora sp.]